jgi:hypothetical protein
MTESGPADDIAATVAAIATTMPPFAALDDDNATLTTSAVPWSPMDHDTTSVPWTPNFPPLGKCNYYVKNDTVVVFNFANQYGGIPQNLLFNLIGWFLLVLLFAVLRRTAGNFGRLALVRKDDDESKWTQLFFAPGQNSVGSNPRILIRRFESFG